VNSVGMNDVTNEGKHGNTSFTQEKETKLVMKDWRK
jgi:hypothetical protein